MTVPALDRDRLLRDLRAAERSFAGGPWPTPTKLYWRCAGFRQALRVIEAAIEDGDYEVDR